MDNNIINQRSDDDGSVHESLKGQISSKTLDDDFLSTSHAASKHIFPLHLREGSHDKWLHPSTQFLPNPINTPSVSLADVLDSSVDNHSPTVSDEADDLVRHGRKKLSERSLGSQRPSSPCSCKSFEVLKWFATQENSLNENRIDQCHSIHAEVDDLSSGTFLNEDQPRPSFESQMPFSHHHLNRDKEEVKSTLIKEVRHLRQELSSQTNKQQALETLLQRALVELEEAKGKIMKLENETARSTSDGEMTITSLQSGLNILQNEIVQESFKRAEQILKLEKKLLEAIKAGGLCPSQEQIDAMNEVLKNEVASDQGVEAEHYLKADLQDVQNKVSVLLTDKDSILPNCTPFPHSVGTPDQLVPNMQQPVTSEMERKASSIIDPTTDKETSKIELEPRQPDKSEQVKVDSANMVATTFEKSSVADLPSTEESSNKDQVFDTFNKMDLKNELLFGIYSYGLARPTSLQQKAIVPCLEGRDVIVQAEPGTGRTTMFSISILQKIDTCLKECQAIVLALDGVQAQHTQKLLSSLGDQMGAQCHAFIGETNICDDLKKLCSSGVHIVIGTPGRVLDMISWRALSTKYIKLLVLDVADEMLSWGFKEQIYDVFKHFSEDIQVILLSAPMSYEPVQDIEDGKEDEDEYSVEKATQILMKNPIHILIKEEELNSEGIKHFLVNINGDYNWRRKIENLEYLYNTLSENDRYDTLHITQAIIFCSSQYICEYVTELLNSLNVSFMHGDLEDRETIMRKFYSGSSRFLITTDILARPVDLQQVSLVINYDLPKEMETYINRIVRSGRFGRKGVAVSFVTHDDECIIDDIKKHYKDWIEVNERDLKDVVEFLHK